MKGHRANATVTQPALKIVIDKSYESASVDGRATSGAGTRFAKEASMVFPLARDSCQHEFAGRTRISAVYSAGSYGQQSCDKSSSARGAPAGRRERRREGQRLSAIEHPPAARDEGTAQCAQRGHWSGAVENRRPG